MAATNPAYEGPTTDKFANIEVDGSPMSFAKDKGKLTKREMLLVAVLILLLVLCIAFLVLFVKERDNDESSDFTRRNTSQRGDGISTQPPTTSVSPTTPDYGRGPWEAVRLPTYFEPIHYEVFLVVDLEKLVFYGNVSVNVKVKNVTSYMYLHVNKLNISSPGLFKSDGSQMSLQRTFLYEKNQFFVMELDSEMKKGEYNVKMNFTGKLDNDLKGLYRSTYKNKDGKEITIATTQMQPTDARKTFPCFDEPSFKATFTVTLVRPKHMISISNMPLESSVPFEKDMFADRYQKTVKMPTYLLAFIVCDFTYKESFAGTKNTSMKYYASKSQIDQVGYARKIGGDILAHFEKYFNISYALPKADMIAIPDFVASGMENWGLIIYKENAMLFKEGQSSESNKERISKVIAHELAHMWFGNLVTMEWWDDLWLNEGFASYVEYIGVEKVKPDWNMRDMFVISDMKIAFILDGLVTSHPIVVPVNHPNEIYQIFDSISYNKGASVIRMLQYFLGESIFRTGLTDYLNAHSYGNSRTKDLWDALTKAAKRDGRNIDVAYVMDTWTLQMGYPVVNVTAEGGDIVLTQQRFLSDPSANQSSTKYTSNFGYKWNVPFTIDVRPAKANRTINPTGLELTWMNLTSDKVRVSGMTWEPSAEWVKGNIGHTGFYRVNYPVENWKLLAQQLEFNHKVLSVADRAGLIEDAFALVDAQLLEFKYALDLTKYLDKEEDYVPWSAAYDRIEGLTKILPKTGRVYKGLMEYQFKKMRPNLDRLGFENNGTHLEKYLRVKAINAACSAKSTTCMKKTKDYFDAWIKNDTKSPVPADFRSEVYFFGMSQSGEKEWDIAFERLQKTNVASERTKIMYSLAGTPEPWLINRYLQYAFNLSKIETQDTTTVVYYVANYNPIGRHFAWSFLKEMWPTILKWYGTGVGFVNVVASAFSTQWELEEVERLFEKHPQTGSGIRAQQQLLEKIHENIQWRKDNEKVLEEWLGKVNV